MKKYIILTGIIITILLAGCRSHINYTLNDLFASGGFIDSMKKNSFMKTHNLHSIKYEEFKSLLSGNTLIREPNKIDKQILLLNKRGTNPNSGLRDIAIEIDINKKTVINTEWGLYAGWDYYPKIGTRTYKITTFKKHFFINSNKTKLFIITSKYTVEYQIIKGHPKEFVKLAKTKNFSHKTIQSTSGLLGGMLLKGMVKILKSSENMPNNSNDTSCHWTTGKSCYKLIKKINNSTYKFECTRGFKIGQTSKVCVNSKGKWANGCGFTSILAHHYNNMSIAANKWCD